MKKTIREWLSELPGDLAAKALANAKEQGPEVSDVMVATQAEALSCGFIWSASLEKGDFWNEVWRSLKQPSPQPDEVATLKARIAELEQQVAALKPKPEWWQQYKKGDLIDIIGVEISQVDTSKEGDGSRIEIKNNFGSGTWLFFDDRHIRPHQP